MDPTAGKPLDAATFVNELSKASQDQLKKLSPQERKTVAAALNSFTAFQSSTIENKKLADIIKKLNIPILDSKSKLLHKIDKKMSKEFGEFISSKDLHKEINRVKGSYDTTQKQIENSNRLRVISEEIASIVEPEETRGAVFEILDLTEQYARDSLFATKTISDYCDQISSKLDNLIKICDREEAKESYSPGQIESMKASAAKLKEGINKIKSIYGNKQGPVALTNAHNKFLTLF